MSNSATFIEKLPLWVQRIIKLVTLPFRYTNIIHRKPTIPFMDAMAQLKTGDIFLARGRAGISRLIEFVSESNWSHVGIIVRPSDINIQVEGDPPHLWESTVHMDVPDLINKKAKRGPMLVDLAKRIEGNLKSGDYRIFGIRYLSVERTPEMLKKLEQFILAKHIDPTDFPEYSDMIIDVLRHRYLAAAPPKKPETFYCSQLASATYQSVGLMPLKPIPKSYLPRDFSAKGYAPFLNRTTLGPEVYLGAPQDDPRYVATAKLSYSDLIPPELLKTQAGKPKVEITEA